MFCPIVCQHRFPYQIVESRQAYINSKITMEQDLEVIVGRAGIPDDETCSKAVLAQSNGVSQAKLVIPFGIRQHAIREAKIELD